MITVYHGDANSLLQAGVQERFLASMPLLIRTGITDYKQPEDRAARLLGKLMLKALLEEYTGADLLEQLVYDVWGKPCIPGFGGDFSISHSGMQAMVAFTLNGKTGIDTEVMRPADPALFDHFFTTGEINEIMNGHEPQISFYEQWTKKEAVLKAMGTGLLTGPHAVHISGEKAIAHGKSWYLHQLFIHADHRTHLATDQANAMIAMRYFTLPG